MITRTVTKTKGGALIEVRKILAKLENLISRLTPSERETLELLIDKKAMGALSLSLKETKQGKLLPIDSMLN